MTQERIDKKELVRLQKMKAELTRKNEVLKEEIKKIRKQCREIKKENKLLEEQEKILLELVSLAYGRV